MFYYYRGLNLEAVREGQWKLVLPTAANAGGKAQASETTERKASLFNLQTDIGESTDIAAQHPEIVARLEKLIAKASDDLGTQGIGPGCRPLGKVVNAQPLIGHDGKVRSGFEPKANPQSRVLRPNIVYFLVDDLGYAARGEGRTGDPSDTRIASRRPARPPRQSRPSSSPENSCGLVRSTIAVLS